ncbi:MAG: AAA family ATPase [Desulfobacterales bacterium]|jgi:general secretion pathway protein A|nr:AAA family ATPase [Desulfobacterales bacterium]
MYSNFFGFSVKPFKLTPDPRFLYLNEGLREVLATLVYGIQERRGFIIIVGEPGTGKTTLLNAAQDQFDENIKVAFILNTSLAFKDMLHMALVDLNLAKTEESLTKRKAIQRLNEFALKQNENGGNVALIIDEAQNLNRHSLENLRLLSNLETHQHKLVQIILAGQPELDITLYKPELRQLVQRIGLRSRTTALCEKDAYEYIQHRLKVAGYKGPQLFGNKAKKSIWSYSQGIPRTINILCDNSLLAGYSLERKRIDSAIVEEAIQDLSYKPLAESFEDSADSEQNNHIFQMERGTDNIDKPTIAQEEQSNANPGISPKGYIISENMENLFFANDKQSSKPGKANIEVGSVEQVKSESVVVTKKQLKIGASIFIALIVIPLIIAGNQFLKLDNRDSVTVYQNDSTSKLDTEKAPSLPYRKLSLVKSDTERPPSLSFPDDHLVIYFNDNSFEISETSLGILNRLAKHIINKQETKLLITGYTDSTGPKSYNIAISKRRAETVKNYLMKKGVKLSKITTAGLGAQDFVASNETENDRRLNRRVEIDLKN